MTWILMVATLTHMPVLPSQGPSYEWKGYYVTDAQGCKDKLAQVRDVYTWHANCHDAAHSVVTPLVSYGANVP